MVLAATLDSVEVHQVIVSPYRRTGMTAAPLARARGITPTVVAIEGTVGDYADAVAAVIRSASRGSTVVVVGHSNTLMPLVAALGGPQRPDLCDQQYASLFWLDLASPTRLGHRSYGEPDPSDALTCHRTMRLDSTSTEGVRPPMTAAPTLREMVGEWTGHNQLWLMPGAPVRESATTATVSLVAGDRYLVMRYHWADEGKPQDGHMIVRLADDSTDTDIAWVDSWHQGAAIMRLAGVQKGPDAVIGRGSYPAPTGPDWGWKVGVFAEGKDRFVMRMWNITPDGQEMLAVEAVYGRR
jgi:hypothetical protein